MGKDEFWLAGDELEDDVTKEMMSYTINDSSFADYNFLLIFLF